MFSLDSYFFELALENLEDPKPTEFTQVETQADVIAASDMIVTFSRERFETPSITWDEDAIKEIEDPNIRNKTFIAIGLFSNELVQWVCKNIEPSARLCTLTS